MLTGDVVHLSQHATLIAKDGIERQISDSAAPIRNGEDDILGMILIFNDISEEYRLREEVEASQRLMQGLVDDLKSMVGIMALDGRVMFINQTPLLLSGVNKRDVLGKCLWQCDWFSSNSKMAENVKRSFDHVLQGEASVVDVTFEAIEEPLWMELSIHPVLASGKITQLVFEGVDISLRKANEALQKNYQLTLEHDVLSRTIELENQAKELARATELKSEFLANISHELRTPMNSIIGFTSRVLKKAKDNLDDRQLNNLKIVERNAHHLLALINGLLDLSKIEAGMMDVHVDKFDFSLLAEDVLSLSQSAADDKAVVLATNGIKGEVILNTDYLKLKQVLINLVNNAIKFTDDGIVHITSQYLTIEDEPHISISVTDTGVGMNDDALQYIFDAFRQIDGKITRKAGGTGLGLAIVRSFTDLLGGTVKVESREGEGAIFEVVIPVDLSRKV